MNKFLVRGICFTAIGIICLYYGIKLIETDNIWYRILLIIGVISFGVGFITLIYRIFRKIDRNSILEERKSGKK